MPTVYLETTIPSYLTARPSSNYHQLAKQEITHDWWQSRRGDFDIYISRAVLSECLGGDSEAAARRIDLIKHFPLLEPKSPADLIAASLMVELSIPPKAAVDAVHLSICIVNEVDFLLTWNFTHIANAAFRPIIEKISESFELACPIICTPEELLER